MLSIRALLICTALLFFVEIGCNSSPTSPVASQGNYTPLQTGIVKQFYYTADSAYESHKIYGTATREDGQSVYIEAVSYLSSRSSLYTQVCYFIRNGYYYATYLIKIGKPINPYGEVRIGKLHPKDGDTWGLYPGVPDSEQTFYTAHYVGDMSTPAGEFHNVYDFQSIDDFSNQLVHSYYAENIGRIATDDGHFKILLNYAKIGDKEYGVQKPIGILPKTNSTRPAKMKFPYLGFF